MFDEFAAMLDHKDLFRPAQIDRKRHAPGRPGGSRCARRKASASSTSARNNAARVGTPRLSGTRRSSSSRCNCSGVTLRSSRTKRGRKISRSSATRARRAVWSSSRNGFGRRRLFTLDSSDAPDMRDFVHAPRSLSRPNRATGLQSNGRLEKWEGTRRGLLWTGQGFGLTRRQQCFPHPVRSPLGAIAVECRLFHPVERFTLGVERAGRAMV
jgi:hypothetical protein